MIDWLPLLVGVVLLFFGRSLFWLGLAILGAVAGWNVGIHWLAGQPVWMELLAALAGAILGIVLALCFQLLAAAWIGFVAGGAAATEIAVRLGLFAPGSATGVDTASVSNTAHQIADTATAATTTWNFPAFVESWSRFLPHVAPTVPYLVGGIVGAVLALLFFDWGLIVLTSLYGAALIVRSVGASGIDGGTGKAGLVIFALLAAVGIAVQAWRRAERA